MRLLAWGVLVLGGCGGSGSSGYTVPRGATLSVRTVDTVASDLNRAGSAFRAAIDVPVREGLVTYIPLQAAVEGVVEQSAILNEDPPKARLTLRLTKLSLPGGAVLPLETRPLVYESKSEVQVEQVTITTGLDVDLDRLLGRTPAGRTRQPGPRVEIPRNSPLVFTLNEDLLIPAP